MRELETKLGTGVDECVACGSEQVMKDRRKSSGLRRVYDCLACGERMKVTRN